MSVKSPSKDHIWSSLLIHKIIVFFAYGTATTLATTIIFSSEIEKDLVSLLSTGAILATFGSAISTIGSICERDILERVKENVDILFKDVFKQERWRRWPFLPRKKSFFLFSGKFVQKTLENPKIPLDVGSHTIKIDLPTVLDDFFDLDVTQNLWKLFFFRKSAHTTYFRKDSKNMNSENELFPMDEYFAYECMFDIWKNIVLFRLARYAIHFGSGLTIASAMSTLFLFIATY